MDAGVASRPIDDFDAYRQRLQQFVYHSGTLMEPIFAAARKLAPDKSRIVFAEGEEERVLRAVQVAIDEKLARPLLRSEQRRVGTEGVSTCRSWWSPEPEHKNTHKT